MIGYFKTDNDDVRIGVDYDHYADNPIIYTGVGLYPLEVNRFFDVKGYDDKLNAKIDDAIEDWDEGWATVYEPSTEQRREFVEQWLTEMGIPFYTTTVTIYRDWVFTGVFYATEDGVTAESIRKQIPALSAWYNGDVYEVFVQKRNTYANIMDLGDRIEKWVTDYDDDFTVYSGVYNIDDVRDIIEGETEYKIVGDMEWGK